MKEIKFRAWDKEKKRMVKVASYEFINFSGDTVIQWGENKYREAVCKNWKNGERLELMQYTGLKDKNGKEVYEGDIIKASDEYPGDELTGVVEWHEQMGFWNVTKICDSLGDILNSFGCEIIGNIYETPELLKEK